MMKRITVKTNLGLRAGHRRERDGRRSSSCRRGCRDGALRIEAGYGANQDRFHEAWQTHHFGEASAARRCSEFIDGWLWWSYVGRAILEELFESPKGTEVNLTIMPRGVVSEMEPEADALNPADAYASGYRSASGQIAGTGRGSSAIIQLAETLSVSDGICNAVMHVPCSSLAAYKTQYVLMHELVHANRMLRGMMRNYAVGERLRNSEEGIAIIVTNMLMSEKGETQLRKTCDTAEVLGYTSDQFLTRPGMESLVRAIGADHPKLKLSINTKDAPVPFNPIYAAFKGAP